MAKVAVLNASQVLILHCLAKNPKKPMDGKSLAEKSGGAVNSGNIGPVFRDVLGNYPESLYALGMVRPIKKEGDNVVWEITSKGIDAAEEYKTKKRYDGNTKVPPKVIDAVMKKFMPLRTYGLESYSSSDLTEILSECGTEYADTPHDFLREQLVNRRKQGAFTNDNDRLARELGQFNRTLAKYELELTPVASKKISKLLQTIAG